MADETPRHPCSRPPCAVLSLALLALLYAASSGVEPTACAVCAQDVCSDGLPRRQINATCCACPPPGPARWALHEGDYESYPPPEGLRTLRLSYTLQPGQLAVDEMYGTAEHELRCPPAYQAFPTRTVNEVELDYRLGNVAGASPAFDVVNGDPQFGYPSYDSWLALGFTEQVHMDWIDVSADVLLHLLLWSEDRELRIDDGGVRFFAGYPEFLTEQPSPAVVAQLSYNATARGPTGSCTAWLGGPTVDGGRWSYPATWTWAI